MPMLARRSKLVRQSVSNGRKRRINGVSRAGRRLRIDQLECRRVLDAGDLDSSFGGDGLVLTDFPGASDEVANDVAIQSDGKIVVAGRTNADFALVRYNTDGSLDTSFGGDGLVVTDIGINSPDAAFALAIQPDGKIVVAGNVGADIALARYNVNGSLDTSFGIGGVVITDVLPGSADAAFDVAIQSDGKIVVAGSTNADFMIARYEADGDLDLDFGLLGVALTDISTGSEDVAFGVVIQPDGRIVAAGRAANDFALARYETDGDLDATFDGDGRVTTDFPGSSLDGAFDLALQVDGKIVAAGTSDADIALARYNINGGVDTTFDGDGLVLTNVPGTGFGNAVAIETDGQIVVAGRSGADFVVVRYNTNGALDTTFDTDGIVTTDFSDSADVAFAVAIQADGRIVAAGSSDTDIALARYLGVDGGPGPDTSFDTIGLRNPAGSTFFLRTQNANGPADIVFPFGPSGSAFAAVSGDWNGDATDTVGVYDPGSGFFFLRNSNSAGGADLLFQFGAGGQGFIPIAGDWNGDGIDTIGLYDPVSGFFFLRNSNSAGFADLTFQFGAGAQGYLPLAGNFDGIGGETVGLYHPPTGVFFLSNTNTAGPAALFFQFGAGGADTLPLADDWDGLLGDSIGIYVRSTGGVFLRNTNTPGPGDVNFVYGPAGNNWQPITGDWNGPSTLAIAGPDAPSEDEHRPPNEEVLETLFAEEEDWLG